MFDKLILKGLTVFFFLFIGAGLYQAYPQPKQPKAQQVFMFSLPSCQPCVAWKKDYNEHKTYENYLFDNVVVVEWDGNHWVVNGSQTHGDLLAQEFVKASGKRISSTPLFWIRGSRRYKVGYSK